jgi:hypothetical protein
METATGAGTGGGVSGTVVTNFGLGFDCRGRCCFGGRKHFKLSAPGTSDILNCTTLRSACCRCCSFSCNVDMNMVSPVLKAATGSHKVETITNHFLRALHSVPGDHRILLHRPLCIKDFCIRKQQVSLEFLPTKQALTELYRQQTYQTFQNNPV